MTDQDPTQPFQPAADLTAQPDPAAPIAAQPNPAAPAWAPPAQPAPPPPPAKPAIAPPLAAAPMTAPFAPPPALSSSGQPPAPSSVPPAATASTWAGAGPAPAGPADAWTPPPAAYGAGAPPPGFDVPMAPVASAPRRPNPVRWLAAILVVALVVVAGLGATLLLTSSTSATSTVLGYVPADTMTYAEARLDLPGSQRAELAKTLSAFPGFADQAALNTKLGELMDRVVRSATNGKHDYQTDIAPWFSGQIAVAQGPQDLSGLMEPLASAARSPTAGPTSALPPCTGGVAAASSPSPSLSGDTSSYTVGSLRIRYLGLASVSDPAKAAAWVGSTLADMSVKTSDQTCDGVVVHVVQANGDASPARPEMGWAILDGKVLVAGDLDSIRLAIATKGSGGLGSTANFQKAVGALKGDHIGLVYEALKATYEAQLGLIKANDTDGTATAALNVLTSLLPEYVAFDLKASDGNFVSTTVEAAPDFAPTTNRTSDLAGLAPPTTIAMLDSHDVGNMLTAVRAKVAAEPKLAPYVKQLDDALGLAGGWDSTIGWIGDAGFAVTRDGSKISGGLLIRPEDASAATHLFTQIRSLADLAGVTSGIKITDETYKGATITTVDLSSLAPSLESGMNSAFGGMTIPSDLKLVYAVTDKVVLMTIDTGFAKAVIDASQGGDSLAKNARYSALLSQAGDKGTSFAWLDVAAARELVEAALPADSRSKYDSDIRPYLLPIDALISTGVYDNGLNRGTLILSIKH